MAGRDTSLALAADIERRDGEVAAALELVGHLGRRADEIHVRSEELQLVLAGAPGELAELERSEAATRDAHAAAAATLTEAERRAAELDSGRPRADASRPVTRELERAREEEAATATRLRQIGAERSALLETEAAARAEAVALVDRANEVALRIQTLPRVSQTGRGAPGHDLAELADWGSRVHAALFVVRGQLEGERDRLVREANELAGAVLGEQVAGSSVTLVRQRLEEALQP